MSEDRGRVPTPRPAAPRTGARAGERPRSGVTTGVTTGATAGAVATGDRSADVVAWLTGRVADLGAEGGTVLVLDTAGRALEVVAAVGYDDAVVERWRRIPVDVHTPLTDAVRTGAAILVPTRSELDSRYPGLSTVADPPVLVALPVTGDDGSAAGVVGLTFRHREEALEAASDLAALGRPAGDVLRSAGYLPDVTAVPSRPASSSPARMHALAAALSCALTPEAVAGVVAREGCTTLGADVAGLLLDAEAAAAPGDDGVALAGIVHEGHPRWRATLTEHGLDGRLHLRSVAVVPLRAAGRPLGTVAFGWVVRQDLPPALLALADEVAALSGTALERAEHFRREERRREAAEAATRRLLALQNVTARLAGAVDAESIADVLVHEAVDAVGAQAVVVSEYDGAGTLTALAAHGMPGGDDPRWHVSRVTESALARELLRTRAPVVVQSLADRDARYPDMAANGVDLEAWANLPLLVGGRVVGIASFAWTRPHAVDSAELEFLSALAGHVGLALDRVRLLRGAKMSAETLQRALLPQALTVAPGWELATAYLPAVEGTQVGGDWYDTFALPDGSVGLVLGDVMGNGLAAASAMGSVRTALRAFATVEADPAEVLARLDAFLETFAAADIVTCVYAVLDPATGRLAHSGAGHPPAVVVEASGDVRWLEDAASTPLGVVPPTPRTTATTTLGPGDLLLLYSDGLVEDRSRSLTLGLAALGDAAVDVVDEADLELGVHLLVDDLLAERRNRDDVAVLALRRRAGA